MEKQATTLHPNDDVSIALCEIAAGTTIEEGVRTAEAVKPGHKVARRTIQAGSFVHRYNQIIGRATTDIAPGEHVHGHNLAMADFSKEYGFCENSSPTRYVDEERTFRGIRRPSGGVATRNYIGVISTVNCSATVTRAVADHFRGRLADYPNVDGVIGLTHKSGCGWDLPVEGINTFKRCFSGFVAHPNFFRVVVVGLGCEITDINDSLGGNPGDTLSIQTEGGSAATVERAIALIESLLPDANRVEREDVPVSELKVALQCGGSDGYSGVSSNPALGIAVDMLVQHGATAILSETTETYGAEHMLTRRAESEEVAQKMIDRIKWWEAFAAKNGLVINNNPSPGNKEGGLTTIAEKSLGSIAKGGSSNLVEVYGYAEPVTAKGLVFMDAPAFDPVGATAQVAGGANLMVFTTGRGSAFGCKPTPSIKLADNTPIFERMQGDMDINCGTILDGIETVEGCGERIFDLILNVASGESTKSELLGYGEEEFSPWDLGLML